MRTLSCALALSVALVACSSEHAAEAPAEQAVREAMQGAEQQLAPATSAAHEPADNASLVVGSCGRPVVDGDGVGAIRIGMDVDTVKARCPIVRDTVELRSEGQPERILVVAFGSDTANVEIDSAKVWRIEIISPGLRTADWLGVGTPLATLLSLEGGVQGLTGEGNLFLVSQARCGLSFELSEPRSPSGNWPAERLRELPKSTAVKRVLVIGCRGWE
jgi:hypothetical protein